MKKRNETITIKPVGWREQAKFEVVYSKVRHSKFGKLEFYLAEGVVGETPCYIIYEKSNNISITKHYDSISRAWFEWVTYLVSECTNYGECCADFIKHRGEIVE